MKKKAYAKTGDKEYNTKYQISYVAIVFRSTFPESRDCSINSDYVITQFAYKGN